MSAGVDQRIETGATTSVELRSLEKTYRSPAGPVHAVRGVDIAVHPGETVALLGPNGAGKSTTIDMLLGLQSPDTGSVAVFGAPPEQAVQQGRIGVMLQTGGVLRELTARELVAMIAALFPQPLEVDEALSLAQIEPIADRRTERLSGGETQRLRFAVALVSDPELLVLDEPTVGMDVEGRHAFWTTVRDLSGHGKTILFATHYLEEADAYADRAVLMARGRVVADGPTTEIKAMVGSRTIRATLPDVAARAARAPSGRHRRRAPGRGSRPRLRGLGCLAARPAARVPGSPRHRSQRGRPRGGLPGPHRRRDRAGGGLMSTVEYARYELLRTFRNRRFYIFSFGFPLVLYYAIAGPNRNVASLGGTGISAPLYFMVGLAAFGTMNAVLGSGARIAAERSVGWNRQLRLTPLSTRTYFRVKVLTAYAMALVAIALLYIAGATLGVRLKAGNWVEMTVLILIGLIPFAGLGILMGHLLTPDSIGPAMGGTTALLALLGGVWFPVTGGAMHAVAEGLPSYWLVQAAHVGLGEPGWGTLGWAVVAAWSVGAALAAGRAYQRDTQRV